MKGPLLMLDQTNEDYLETLKQNCPGELLQYIWYLGLPFGRQIRIWWQNEVKFKRRHPSGLGVLLSFRRINLKACHGLGTIASD